MTALMTSYHNINKELILFIVLVIVKKSLKNFPFKLLIRRYNIFYMIKIALERSLRKAT